MWTEISGGPGNRPVVSTTSWPIPSGWLSWNNEYNVYIKCLDDADNWGNNTTERAFATRYPTQTPVQIILDTDLATDCDDLGVVAMLHAYANQGIVRILGMVCNVSDDDSPLCLNAVNAYYGRSDIPIGKVAGGFVNPVNPLFFPTYVTPNYPNRYTAGIATNYPTTLQPSSIPDAIDVYVQQLESNSNVVIVSVGSFYNLKRLLSEHPALVRDRVAKLVVMGGYYPPATGSILPDYNLSLAPDASKFVIDNWPLSIWPTPIVFTGLGFDVLTGTNLFDNPAVSTNNPIRLGYDLGTREARIDTGQPAGSRYRPSWDQIALLYAVEGAGAYFQESQEGANLIPTVTQLEAWNVWTTLVNKHHQYLNQVASSQTLKTRIESLMTARVRTVINFFPIIPNPLSISASDLDLISNGLLTVNAGQQLQIRSSNSNVVMIVNGSKLRAVGVGTATVTVSFSGSSCFEPASETSRTVQVTAALDSDGDGMPDWAEAVAGTDPTNRQSCFSIAFPVSGSFSPNGNGMVLQWPSASNRVYHIDRSTNLLVGFNQIVATNIPAIPPLNTHTDSTANTAGPNFYEIRVEQK